MEVQLRTGPLLLPALRNWITLRVERKPLNVFQETVLTVLLVTYQTSIDIDCPADSRARMHQSTFGEKQWHCMVLPGLSTVIENVRIMH